MKTLRPVLGKVLPFAFYALIGFFVVLLLINTDYSQLKNLSLSWGVFTIATILELLFRFWAVLIWIVILLGLGAQGIRGNLGQLTFVYSKAWLGRYIPGRAPWILGKIYFASKLGVSKTKLAVSSLLEAGLQVLVLLIISSLMLLADSRTNAVDANLRWLILAVTILSAIVLLPPIFNRLVSLAHRVIKHQSLAREHYASSSTILKGVLLYGVGAFMTGLSFFFIIKSVYPDISYHDIWYVTAIGNLSGAIGMLAVFTPSGLGVREGVQIALLSIIIPVEVAIIVTVLARLWSLGVDFLFLGIGLVVKRLNRPVN